MRFPKLKLLAALTFGAFVQTSVAADYPSKPVTMVIPYGSGGATDISARTLSDPLGKLVDQPLLMVNRTGAGGTNRFCVSQKCQSRWLHITVCTCRISFSESCNEGDPSLHTR